MVVVGVLVVCYRESKKAISSFSFLFRVYLLGFLTFYLDRIVEIDRKGRDGEGSGKGLELDLNSGLSMAYKHGCSGLPLTTNTPSFPFLNRSFDYIHLNFFSMFGEHCLK